MAFRAGCAHGLALLVQAEELAVQAEELAAQRNARAKTARPQQGVLVVPETARQQDEGHKC